MQDSAVFKTQWLSLDPLLILVNYLQEADVICHRKLVFRHSGHTGWILGNIYNFITAEHTDRLSPGPLGV